MLLRARRPHIPTFRRKLQLISKFFSCIAASLKNNAYGRANTGRRVCWTKGRHALQKNYQLHTTFVATGGWWCIIDITRILKTQTCLARYITTTGVTANFFWLKNLIKYSCILCSPFYLRAPYQFATYCGCCSNLSTIANLELKAGSGAKLIRAAGSRGCPLFTCSLAASWLFILLPSGLIKLISKYASCTRSRTNFQCKRYLKQPGAGLYTNLGRHPNVRGVAMNATDHPNGGKTHTLHCAKTPWGKIAKYT